MDISYFLASVEKWTKEDENIKAVILIGSYARGDTREDSDVDLVIITTRPVFYVIDESFVNKFGRVLKTQKENWGAVTSIRAWYDDKLEVEFGITSPVWASRPLDKGTFRVLSDGYKVIVDKENYFKGI
jgi:predicted nucleotidyltransferase